MISITHQVIYFVVISEMNQGSTPLELLALLLFGAPAQLYDAILDELSGKEFDLESLAAAGENPIFDKYDEFIPAELLRKAYASDRLQNPITF